jgi:hypothetical protein
MKRIRLFLVQIGVICMLLGLASPIARAEDEVTGVAANSTAALQECVKTERSLSVLFLVDVSSSLISGGKSGNGSDPKGLRADTLEAVVELLNTPNEMAIQNRSGLEVEAAFLDFGSAVRNSFDELSNWNPLQEVFDQKDLLARFKSKVNDQATDYVGALEPNPDLNVSSVDGEKGAIEMLDEAKSPCRILIWLTDGKFDLGKATRKVSWDTSSSSQGRLSRGTGYLCDNDPRFGEPLVDRLRDSSDGRRPVFIGAVGLGGEDFSLIKRIAEGGDCGKKQASGKFVQASKPQELLDALTQLVLPTVDPPKPAECVSLSEPKNDSIFHLNETVERVNVLVSALIGKTDVSVSLRRKEIDGKISDTQIVLVDDGKIIEKPESIDGVSDISVNPVYSVGNVSFLLVKATFDSSKGNWEGDWFTEFCREDGISAEDKSTVFVYGGVSAELLTEKLIAGRTEEIVIQLKARKSAEPLQDISKIVFNEPVASVAGVQQKVRIESDGRAVISYKPTDRDVGSSKKISFSATPALKFSDSKNGLVTFDPVEYSKDLEVVLPPKTPTIIAKAGTSWGHLAKGALKQERTFVVKPGEEDGTVCFKEVPNWSFLPTDFEGNPKLKFSNVDEANCIEVKKSEAEGKEITVAVSVTAKQLKIQTNSNIRFDIPFKAQAAGESELGNLETQAIPIDSALSISIQWIKAILYLLLAVLIPICLLWVYNALVGSRLVVPDRGIFMYQKKLIFDDNGTRVDPSSGSGALFQAGDMKLAPVGNGRVRSIALPNLSVRGKFSWLSPFSTPFAEASNNSNKQVIGPDGANLKTRAGFSPLSIEDVWYVQIDTEKQEGLDNGSQSVDLVVLVADPREGERAVEAAVKKARSRISEFKTDLAEAERVANDAKPEGRSKREPEVFVAPQEEAQEWLLGGPTKSAGGDMGNASVDGEEKSSRKRRFAKSDKEKPQDKPQDKPDDIDPSQRLL